MSRDWVFMWAHSLSAARTGFMWKACKVGRCWEGGGRADKGGGEHMK